MRYVYILVYADTAAPQWAPTISAVYGSKERANSEADVMNKIAIAKGYLTFYYVKKEVVH